MQQCLLLCMSFLKLFFQYPYIGKKKFVKHIRTCKSDPRQGKIIPIACLTRRPVHRPTSKNMEMNMIDRLAPIWTFIHNHSIALLQAQISSTFLANNYQIPKKTFIIIFCCRNVGYMFLGVSPENVLVLEGKCHRKQDTGHPHKWFWLGFPCEWSSWRSCCRQAGRPEPWRSHLSSLPPFRAAGQGCSLLLVNVFHKIITDFWNSCPLIFAILLWVSKWILMLAST